MLSRRGVLELTVIFITLFTGTVCGATTCKDAEKLLPKYESGTLTLTDARTFCTPTYWVFDPSKTDVACTGTTCESSECCVIPGECKLLQCGTGTYAGAKKYCAGTQDTCTQDECCLPKPTCSEGTKPYYPSGWMGSSRRRRGPQGCNGEGKEGTAETTLEMMPDPTKKDVTCAKASCKADDCCVPTTKAPIKTPTKSPTKAPTTTPTKSPTPAPTIEEPARTPTTTAAASAAATAAGAASTAAGGSSSDTAQKTKILLGVLIPAGFLALFAILAFDISRGGTCFGAFTVKKPSENAKPSEPSTEALKPVGHAATEEALS